jgi:hypothetical protein
MLTEDMETAQLGNTFTSVTLCPNVAEYDKKGKVSIIDLAGYRNRTDYIGVLGSSYFRKETLLKVSKIKFLIVIREDALMDKSGEGIISTLSGFTSLFNFSYIDENLRSELYASISVVFTASERPNMDTAYLLRTLRILNDPNITVDNQEELVRLINYIIQVKRFESFVISIPNY